jgi:sulfonate transport system substrate-binding protein
MLRDFLTRLAKASRWEGDHKAEFAAVLARETGLPSDVALFTVSLARGAPTPIDASIVAEEHDTMNHFVKAGVIPTAPNIDGAFDPAFNDALKP